MKNWLFLLCLLDTEAKYTGSNVNLYKTRPYSETRPRFIIISIHSWRLAAPSEVAQLHFVAKVNLLLLDDIQLSRYRFNSAFKGTVFRRRSFFDAPFFEHPKNIMEMTEDGKGPEMLKGMKKMGALIWFLFVLLVTVVVERESFFP